MDVLRSIPRKYLIFLTVVSGVMIALGFGIVQKAQINDSFMIAKTQFKAEYVESNADKARGLSGRSGLADQSTLVFVWDESSQQCFWMKDMQFNIDIVWLDTQKKVVATEQNLSPASYPQQYCHEGQYVAEFAAGTVNRLGIKPGDTAKF